MNSLTCKFRLLALILLFCMILVPQLSISNSQPINDLNIAFQKRVKIRRYCRIFLKQSATMAS